MYRILELNPQLEPFSGDIDLRMHLYRSTKKRILSEGQSLNDFANAHLYFGFHHVDGGWYYREWAPSAYQLYLEGDFNGWNQTSHPLTNLGNGSWELYLPGDNALWDGCKVKNRGGCQPDPHGAHPSVCPPGGAEQTDHHLRVRGGGRPEDLSLDG